jgi:NAD(P)-dependent dehydrogenase (short-subunit alcohol dehydrogenase family)
MAGVVVVTGAGRGLGRAVTEDLLARGTEVLAADLHADALAELTSSHPAGLTTHAVDVADEASVADLARVAEAAGPTAVVHCAALVAVTRAPAAELTVEEFDRVMAVNARGSWLIGRAALALLAPTRGSLVLFTSETAFTGSHGLSHYVASKGAVLSLMRAFAREGAPAGVRVNAIAPGFTDTAGARALADPERYDTSATPLGRVGQPDDIVGAVRYLIGDDSAFVTGQTLHINGGRYVT